VLRALPLRFRGRKARRVTLARRVPRGLLQLFPVHRDHRETLDRRGRRETPARKATPGPREKLVLKVLMGRKVLKERPVLKELLERKVLRDPKEKPVRKARRDPKAHKATLDRKEI